MTYDYKIQIIGVIILEICSHEPKAAKYLYPYWVTPFFPAKHYQSKTKPIRSFALNHIKLYVVSVVAVLQLCS